MADSNDELKKISIGSALLRLLEDGIKELKGENTADREEIRKRKELERAAAKEKARQDYLDSLQPRVDPEAVRIYLEQRKKQDEELIRQRQLQQQQRRRGIYGD